MYRNVFTTYLYLQLRPLAGQFLARFSSAHSESNLWSLGRENTHFILLLFWWFLPINFPTSETTIFSKMFQYFIKKHFNISILMSHDLISQYFNLLASDYEITFHSPPLRDFLLIFPLQDVVLLPKCNVEFVCCEESFDYFWEILNITATLLKPSGTSHNNNNDNNCRETPAVTTTTTINSQHEASQSLKGGRQTRQTHQDRLPGQLPGGCPGRLHDR